MLLMLRVQKQTNMQAYTCTYKQAYIRILFVKQFQ